MAEPGRPNNGRPRLVSEEQFWEDVTTGERTPWADEDYLRAGFWPPSWLREKPGEG